MPDPTTPLAPGGNPAPGTQEPPAGQLPLPAPHAGNDAPPAGDPPPAPTPDEHRFTSAALDRRLARERASVLKSLGFDSEEAARAAVQQAKAVRDAQLTKEQRLEEQLAAERARAEKAERDRDEAAFSARLTQLCAQRGIKDVEYARYLVEQAAEGSGGGEFDAGSFLDGELQKPSRRAAFGIDGPPNVVEVPVTRTPHNPNQPHPPPAPPGRPNGQVDVMNMSKAEADKYTRERYGV